MMSRCDDDAIEAAVVDCHGELETITGFYTMIEDNLRVPFTTEVLGMEVTVEGVALTDAQDMTIVTDHRSGRRVVAGSHALFRWLTNGGTLLSWLRAPATRSKRPFTFSKASARVCRRSFWRGSSPTSRPATERHGLPRWSVAPKPLSAVFPGRAGTRRGSRSALPVLESDPGPVRASREDDCGLG